MLTYSFSKIGSESLYMYLYKCIREDILTGQITPGTKLPSKRSFAENLGVSVITVENAYAQLVSEGYVYALPKKGFFAANLVTVVPVNLYTFCISLQNVFLKDLAADYVGAQSFNLGEVALKVLAAKFGPPTVGPALGLLNLLTLIALAYCVLKVFFANIKRGGILLIQMAVGSLYLFSVPRGYTDGFSQWCKQIFALCLTAFLQTTLLFLGLLTFQDNLLLGLGIMLAAGEVPRIAQQFGLDSSVKVNMMSVVHATSTAVNMTKNIAKSL
jgi:hypothetical protein